MKLQNRLTFSILIIAMTLIGSGCWSYRELETLGIVSGAGFDLGKDPEQVLLTVQVIKASKGKGGGNGSLGDGQGQGSRPQPVAIVESNGATAFEAVRNAVSKFSRRLYWPHNQILIVGKEAAENGVKNYLNFGIRQTELRPTAWIMISPGKAGDLIRAPGEMGQIPAMEIKDMLQAQSATSEIGSFTFYDFIERLMSKTTAPLATQIRLNKEGEVELAGTAIFKGEKLVGFIGKKETRGLLWVIGKIKSGVVIVKAPANKGKVSLGIIHAAGKIQAETKNDSVKITVKVNVQSGLGEQTGDLDTSKPEVIKSLARREATVIRNEINAAFKKAQELNADIFGFGEAVHRADFKAWKKLEPRWDEIFPKLKVKLIVKTNISLNGLINKPISQK
ncbi:MAG: Ger(x)C family spore germination protein [Firmicutes bacterium]|nr:Ger(x)C family spore germination protein [Bacillota bacterium]